MEKLSTQDELFGKLIEAEAQGKDEVMLSGNGQKVYTDILGPKDFKDLSTFFNKLQNPKAPHGINKLEFDLWYNHIRGTRDLIR